MMDGSLTMDEVNVQLGERGMGGDRSRCQGSVDGTGGFQLGDHGKGPTNYYPELCNDIPTLEAGFEAWTEYAKKTVPASRLLVFDVRQGWQPLCHFLGEPVPTNQPFPHINDRVVVDIIVKVFVVITWVWPLLFVLPLLVAYFLISACRRRQQGEGKLMTDGNYGKKQN